MKKPMNYGKKSSGGASGATAAPKPPMKMDMGIAGNVPKNKRKTKPGGNTGNF